MTAVALAGRLAGLVAWSLVGIVVARGLPVADRGAYATALVVAGAILAASSGIAAAVGQAVASRRLGASQVLAVSVAAGVAVSVLAGLAAMAVGQGVVAIGLVVVAAVALPSIVRSALATLLLLDDRLLAYNLASHGPAVATLVAVVGLSLAGALTLPSALAAWAGGQLAGLLAAAFVAARTVPAPRLGDLRAALAGLREVLPFSALAGLTALLVVLGSRVDLLIVGALGGREATGQYATASAVLDLLVALGVSVSVASYRRIGTATPSEGARLAMTRAGLAMAGVAAAAAVVLVAAPVLVETVFGPRYLPAVDAVRVMALAAIAWAPQPVLGTYLVVTLGRPGLGLGVAAATVAAEALLTAVLVGRLGLVGGAWASLVAYDVGLAIALGLVARLGGLRVGDSRIAAGHRLGERRR